MNQQVQPLARALIMFLRLVMRMIGRGDNLLRDVILEMSGLESRLVSETVQTMANLGCDRTCEEPPVVYAVHTRCPIYVGSSLEPLRRLPDLCEGESHHLAKLLPILGWELMMVVRLDLVLGRYGDLEAGIRAWGERRGLWPVASSEGAPHGTEDVDAEQDRKARRQVVREIAKTIEREVQLELRPLINTKRRFGRRVRFVTSGTGQRVRAQWLHELFPGALAAVLRELAELSKTEAQNGETVVHTGVGAVIFVQRFFAEYEPDGPMRRVFRLLEVVLRARPARA